MKTFIVCCVLASASAGAASADVVPPLARQLSDRGRALHDLGDYEQAIVAYKQAYLIAPSPGLLFNLAQAYRLEGDCSEAASFYRRFLDTDPEAAARKVAELHLAAVSSCAEQGGGRSALAIAAKVEPLDDEPGRGKRRAGMAFAGAGVLLAAGGAYFAVDARDASDQISSQYMHGGNWKQIADLDARGRRSSELATGLFIAGGAAIATGAVLYMIGHREDERAPAVTIGPTARGGASVGVSWRF